MAATQLDYEALSKLLLTTQYQRPLIEALVGALSGPLQEADDVALRLPEECLGLDSAVGVQLEQLIDLVGAPLIGGEDQLRALGRTWIRRNRSRGTLNDVIAVVQLFPVADFDVEELLPARIEVTAFSVPAGLGETLALVISGTRAAGVGAGVVASAVDRENTFQYSSTGPTETSVLSGYGFGEYAGGYPA